MSGAARRRRLLKPGEYNGLPVICAMKSKPADLLSPDAGELFVACRALVDGGRLEHDCWRAASF